MKNETAVVDIFELTFDGGKGVGKLPDGKVVFVPQTAPGDQVKVKILKNKKSYCTAELQSILKPSAFRQEPSCPIYFQCGGCNLQHLKYEAQINAKQKILKRFIERKSSQTKLYDFVLSQPNWHYRNRLEVHFKDSNWGFYKPKTHQLVFTKKCLIAQESLNECLNQLEVTNGHVHVSIDPKDKSKTLVQLDRTRGDSGVFSQINTDVNLKLKGALTELLESLNWGQAIDFYAGAGNFSEVISTINSTAPLHCVEWSKDLVLQGQEQLAPHTNIQWHNLRCEDFDWDLISEKKSTTRSTDTTLVLNPPRQGAAEALLQQIVQRPNINNLIYISCNPPLLFRDFTLFKQAGFELKSLQGFDMFPQTMHFEALAHFQRL